MVKKNKNNIFAPYSFNNQKLYFFNFVDLEIRYFEKLKEQIQQRYLQNHMPVHQEISKWKGLDITYFQEDLIKYAKGNISEKSFYTYFKNPSSKKIPRIDILNLLCLYTGYESWSDFKIKNLIPEHQQPHKTTENQNLTTEKTTTPNPPPTSLIRPPVLDFDLPKKTLPTEEKIFSPNQEILPKKSYKIYGWILGGIFILSIAIFLFIFKNHFFGQTFTYCFTDADRSGGVKTTLEINVFKENESPLLFKIKPGECFKYHTKDKILKMEIHSPFYENLQVTRNLQTAPNEENIELKPDDYKFAFYYFSLKEISGNSQIIEQKRKELENRISPNAEIKQIYDSDIYGVETISKEKYITLVTTPTTSLKNLTLLEMKRNEKGKITSIKFKITDNEKN